MPLTEYPFDGSWGYQVIGYFAATSRYGTPKDLMYLIDKAHQAGLGVIMDWFRRTSRRTAADWSSLTARTCTNTPIRSKWSTRNGARAYSTTARSPRETCCSPSAMFWIEKFHMDGLRVDAVASMLYLDYNRQGEWRPNVHGRTRKSGGR